MRPWIRILAASCALLMVALAFQTVVARANPPTSANEFNHALAANGGTAKASGYSGSNTPAKAIDGSTSTYWQSSTTTGWIVARFKAQAYVNVVHIHFSASSKVYPKLSLYFDLNGNDLYETSEKVWSVTSNPSRDVVASTATYFTLGMKLTIDAKVGSSKPMVAEFEAFISGDTDGDGLTNAEESGITYFQDASADDLPLTVPDDGESNAASVTTLAQFYGVGVGALANITVDHARKADLTAQIGYWDGTQWNDRYVWDPGRRLTRVTITQPTADTFVDASVNVVAWVDHPDLASKVEYRVRGVLQNTVTAPVGNEYRWTWNAATFAEGPAALNATLYDTLGGRAWSQITVNVDHPPQVTWGSPADGSTVSGSVAIQVDAVDYYGISSVAFHVDGMVMKELFSPNVGASGYKYDWPTSGYCSNTQHTLKAVVTENRPPFYTTTRQVTVTANTYPLVCITTPANGATVQHTVTVTAAPVAGSGKTITQVDFYLENSFRASDTTSPYTWSWDTTAGGNGYYYVMAKAYDSSQGTASSTIRVLVSNVGVPCKPGDVCPQSAAGSVGETPVAVGISGGVGVPGSAVLSSPSPTGLTLGILTSEWKRGEADQGTQATVVVDLVKPQTGASAGENASRIIRPGFPLSYFATYLTWHLVVRDWNKAKSCLPPGDPACEIWPPPGQIVTFMLRFEAQSDPAKADTDADGIPDGREVKVLGTIPVAGDSDADGLSDGYEITPHPLTLRINGVVTTLPPFTTLPANPDTDGDGLSDGEERSPGVDRLVTNPIEEDTDADGLWDGFDVNGFPGELSHNSNSTRTDTDGDTISDWDEIRTRQLMLTVNGLQVPRYVSTLPYAEDSDGDGLADNDEWSGSSVYGVKTDPSAADTDGDGLPDGQERYMKEVAMPTRRTVGYYLSVSLAATLGGSVEKATLSSGFSGIDVSNYYVELTKDSNTIVVRNFQGSGLYNFSSTDLPSSMWSSGTFTLNVWAGVTGGILEKFGIVFTIRTSPILSDSDGDGLNDMEETTYGQDGWITDPWLVDSDGDSWDDSYERSQGTNPLSRDTDGDGASDNVDRDPLHNLLVQVTVYKIHHGAGPWCSPELLAAIRVNDDYTWFTQHLIANEEPFISVLCRPPVPTLEFSTRSFSMTYYADVPDAVTTVNLRLTAWSVNPFPRGDDILVDKPFTYTLGSGTVSGTFWNSNSWISYAVSTYALEKARTLLITDGQVSTVSGSGQTRMAGPNRFAIFALDLNAPSTQYPLDQGINSVVVPRPVFLDSKLGHDLSDGIYAPLTEDSLYWDDRSKAQISDGVATVFGASLTASEANDVMGRLLLNASGGASHSYVDISGQALAAYLSQDVIRILPWQKVTSGPTGSMPLDFWGKIGLIATILVNTLLLSGQLLFGGLMAFTSYLSDLAGAISNWGMLLLGAVWQAAPTVLGIMFPAFNQMNLEAMRQFASTIMQGLGDLQQKLVAYVNGVADALVAMLTEMSKWNVINGDESLRATDLAVVAFALSFVGLQNHAEQLVSTLRVMVQMLAPILGSISPFNFATGLASWMGYNPSAGGSLWDGALGSIGHAIGEFGGLVIGYLTSHSFFNNLIPQNAAAGFPLPNWSGFSMYIHRTAGLDILGPVRPAVLEVVDGLGSTLNISPLSVVALLLFILSFGVNVGALLAGEEAHPLGLILSVSMFLITLPVKLIHWGLPKGNAHAVVGLLLGVLSLGMSAPAVVSGTLLGAHAGGVGAVILGAILVANFIVAAIGFYQSLEELKQYPLPG